MSAGGARPGYGVQPAAARRPPNSSMLEAAPRIVEYYESLKDDDAWSESAIDNLSMTAFLQALIDGGFSLQAVTTEGGWLEVDSVDDLDRYRRMLDDGTLADFWSAPPA